MVLQELESLIWCCFKSSVGGCMLIREHCYIKCWKLNMEQRWTKLDVVVMGCQGVWRTCVGEGVGVGDGSWFKHGLEIRIGNI